MGRTKRKRLKKYEQNSVNLCHEEHLVSLQKWMSNKGWKNHKKLSLKLFPETGRGISSKITVGANEVLLSIPMNIMITYTTVKLDIPVKNIFTIHESLALFLINEKEKGINSYWTDYINSLPEKLPPLTWLANEEEIELFPSDIKLNVEYTTTNFKNFLNKTRDFIPNNSTLADSLLKWAYVMVNTRAVYVDPHIICEESSLNLLKDEPSMGLCPFLDMFNHNYLANTEVSIINEGGCLFYELRTLSSCKNRHQKQYGDAY
ncbi:SET domain-containing protein 4 isoform X1 [Diorhabda carinulata]|uniref:SET domain-containing protein 4 isoform X1 n=1 Tax=Diorhabda carinulata TaxID=1163345 RepID=UPI0025A00569|nr:SET domain-containing protein 4 isoform X1 [Diorhabda carinulata]